jgi:small subunit ribosomal protein S16
MLAIKFRRIGKRNQAAYRIVVGERRSKLRGKYREDLGWYNPQNKTYTVDADRARYWIEHGAQPTDTVHNLLVRARVLSGAKKRSVHSVVPADEVPAEQPVAEAAPEGETTPAPEAPAESPAKTE